MRITRFGHACLLVETSSSRLLVDPGGFSAAEAFALTDLDAILVTHQHPDHLDRSRIGALVDRNPSAARWADPETAAALSDTASWRATADGWETVIGDLRVTGVGDRHATILPTLPAVANVGLLVRQTDGSTLFHPGDSYASTPPAVDVLALPLSAPWAKISETVAFVQAVRPRLLFPIHDATISERAYGIYWNHVVDHGGVDECLRLGPTDSFLMSR